MRKISFRTHDKNLLATVRDRVTTCTGIHVPRDRWPDLVRQLELASADAGLEDWRALARAMKEAPLNRALLEILTPYLTIGETFFLRDAPLFDLLVAQIIPEAAARKQRAGTPIRIWSTACSSGEEPYSIAMSLDRALPDLDAQTPVVIFGTDINPKAIDKAQRGIYSRWSFRAAPPWLMEDYFEQKTHNAFELVPRIKERVRFSLLNLLDGRVGTPFDKIGQADIILCRNALMYLHEEARRRVVGRLARTLAPNGCLIVATAEAPLIDSNLLSAVRSVPIPVFERAEDCTGSLEKQTLSARLQALHDDRDKDAGAVSPPARRAGPDAALREARAATDAGRYDLATQRPQALSGSKPPTEGSSDTAESMLLTARGLANQGRLREAAKWCDKALSVDSLLPTAHYLGANISQELGDMAGAVRSLRRSLFLDPDFVMAHYSLGNLLSRSGMSRESHRHFRNALSLLNQTDPGQSVPHSGGMVAGRLRDLLQKTLGGQDKP